MATKLSAQQISTLLSKLSTDDKFRTAFEQDAAAALSSLGMPSDMAACCRGHKLASKEQLAKSLSTVQDQLLRTREQNVHDLVVR